MLIDDYPKVIDFADPKTDVVALFKEYIKYIRNKFQLFNNPKWKDRFNHLYEWLEDEHKEWMHGNTSPARSELLNIWELGGLIRINQSDRSYEYGYQYKLTPKGKRLIKEIK